MTLGKALKKSRFNKQIIHADGSTRHTTDIIENLGSITQENDLEAFLSNAKLADTDFTAQKLNAQVIVQQTTLNPFVLTKEQEKEILSKYAHHEDQLTIPRRPPWDHSTTPEQLQLAEKSSFLNWRRSLVILEEDKGLLMTPYERNLDIWRQLWRVTERSDLVVQIVDARHPQLFRCPDLEVFVQESEPRRKNLLLINKADMLSPKQRYPFNSFYSN
jgi:large subunit GTPase 1